VTFFYFSELLSASPRHLDRIFRKPQRLCCTRPPNSNAQVGFLFPTSRPRAVIIKSFYSDAYMLIGRLRMLYAYSVNFLAHIVTVPRSEAAPVGGGMPARAWLPPCDCRDTRQKTYPDTPLCFRVRPGRAFSAWGRLTIMHTGSLAKTNASHCHCPRPRGGGGGGAH
jgi:hypothetical protein